MDLTKDTIRSDSADAQESMGVIDPLDAKVTTLQGRGKRITLRDASEKVLADIIIGNDIKGTDRKEGGAMQYVRVPGQKRIYGVNIKAEPSTRFADWIETNLLKLEASKIRRIVFDNYKLQEDPNRQGRLMLQRGEKSTITRKDGTGPWTMADLPAGQELVEDKLRALTDALGDLKIVGVRPRPAGLKNLDQEDLKLTQMVMASLQNKGFFLTTQGLFSDQGDVLVATEDGVVYYAALRRACLCRRRRPHAWRCRRRREEGRAGQERRRQEVERDAGKSFLDGDGCVRSLADRQARIAGNQASPETGRAGADS